MIKTETYLENYEGPVGDLRNPTDTSKQCEDLVKTFLRNGADMATVRTERIGVDPEKLYKSLWGVTRKNDYRHRVSVHKQEQSILLIRMRGTNGQS